MNFKFTDMATPLNSYLITGSGFEVYKSGKHLSIPALILVGIQGV
jgi:hypothetical protein